MGQWRCQSRAYAARQYLVKLQPNYALILGMLSTLSFRVKILVAVEAMTPSSLSTCSSCHHHISEVLVGICAAKGHWVLLFFNCFY